MRELPLPPPLPGMPGVFRLSDSIHVERVFALAGFAQAQIEPVMMTVEMSSAEEYARFQQAILAPFNTVLSRFSAEQQAQVWQAILEAARTYTTQDGTCRQDPGLLIAREGGRISLVTLKEKVFEAEKHEIVARWPWYQFGQGVRLKVAGKTYWFAWISGGATSQAWGMRERMEVVSTLAGREGLNFAHLASTKAWRRYLKTWRTA